MAKSARVMSRCWGCSSRQERCVAILYKRRIIKFLTMYVKTFMIWICENVAQVVELSGRRLMQTFIDVLTLWQHNIKVDGSSITTHSHFNIVLRKEIKCLKYR